MTLPLARLKIVVTRLRDQAVQLAKRIVQAGGEPLLLPLPDIAAVQYGFAAMRAANSDLFLSDLRIATIGKDGAMVKMMQGLARKLPGMGR